MPMCTDLCTGPPGTGLLSLVASGDIGRTALPNYLLVGSRERGGKFRLSFLEELAYVSPVLPRALGLQ